MYLILRGWTCEPQADFISTHRPEWYQPSRWLVNLKITKMTQSSWTFSMWALMASWLLERVVMRQFFPKLWAGCFFAVFLCTEFFLFWPNVGPTCYWVRCATSYQRYSGRITLKNRGPFSSKWRLTGLLFLLSFFLSWLRHPPWQLLGHKSPREGVVSGAGDLIPPFQAPGAGLTGKGL